MQSRTDNVYNNISSSKVPVNERFLVLRLTRRIRNVRVDTSI